MKKSASPEKTTVKLSPEEIRQQFEHKLHELYWCENKLSSLLPELSTLATSYELASAILGQLAVTENQIIRLIHIFDAIGERASGNKCDFIENLLSEYHFFDSESGFNRDTEIIHCCQKITLYQIETYTKLRNDAVKLKEELATEFLASAIKEEKNAHNRLSEISLTAIYFDAAS